MMRWNVDDNDPPLVSTGAEVLLNGVAVKGVRALDTDQGWVDVLCYDAHTGRGGKAHVDPKRPGEACTLRAHGTVKVVGAPHLVES